MRKTTASPKNRASGSSPRRVALAFPYGRAFVETVVDGIYEYARKETNWHLIRFPERLSPSLEWLRGWNGDGAFVIFASKSDVELARTLPFPVVNLTAYFPSPGITTVTADHREIGRMAAMHLLERRFQKFGFYGSRELYFSELRREGFVSTIRDHGATCSVLEVSPHLNSGRSWLRQEQELERWLLSLQPPVAVMASTDLRANMLMESCRHLEIKIPEQLAVIGVDNDPVVVEHIHPTLSSIARNDRAAGEAAARELVALMTGKARPGKWILMPPTGVIARQSTETLAVEDPDINGLVQYIRQHVGEKFGVERLLEITGWSRRRLEMRFQEHLGEAPYSLINRLRVEEAQRLMKQNPSELLSRIATASGFNNLRQFRLVFQRITGQRHSRFRSLCKNGDA